MSATRGLMDDYEAALLGPSCWQTFTACLQFHYRRLYPASAQHQPLRAPPLVTIPDAAVPGGAYTPPQPNQPLWLSPASQHSSSALSSLSATDSLSQGTFVASCQHSYAVPSTHRL